MEAAYTVALVGFSQSEAATLESFLRLAARRPPAYRVQDEVLDAQVLLVNADNAQAMDLVRSARLPGRVLLLGANDGGTGWPLERKPLRFVSLLGSLDSLVGQRTARAMASHASAPSFSQTEPFKASQLQGLEASMKLATGKPLSAAPLAPARSRRRSPDTEFPPTRPMTRAEMMAGTVAVPVASAPPPAAPPAPAPAPTPRPAPVSSAIKPASASPSKTANRALPDYFDGLEDMLNVSPPAPRARNTRSPQASRFGRGDEGLPETPRGDALLVGQSLVEGRILLKRFRKYELSIDWCREPAQAQAMMKAHAYRLVVIDRLSGEPDAFQICRTAKQNKGRAPTVIMFAPTAGSMDRMKAGLAGADAYLSRSVSEAELYKVLANHRLVNLNGFAPTNIGSF